MDRLIKTAENRSARLIMLFTAVIAAAVFAGSFFLHRCENRAAAVSEVEYRLGTAGLLRENTDLTDDEIASLLTDEFDDEDIGRGEGLLSDYGYKKGQALGGEYAYSPHFWSDMLCVLGVLLTGLVSFLLMGRLFSQLRAMTRDTEQQKQLFAGDDRDVTLLCEAINELCRKNRHLLDKLADEKRYLAEYLHDFSHQIKTPCTGLMLNNDILINNPMPYEEQLEYFENDKLCLDRITLLCSASLRLARLDAGVVEYSFERVPLGEIVNAAFEQLKGTADSRGVELISEIDDSTCLECDKFWLGEAVTNLVKNACEHTEKGYVKAYCESDPVTVRLFIEDNGSGISGEELPKVFRRFYSRSEKTDPQSVGIGMSIAKKITEDMKGRIFIESEKGRGTKIKLEFLTAEL